MLSSAILDSVIASVSVVICFGPVHKITFIKLNFFVFRVSVCTHRYTHAYKYIFHFLKNSPI